MKSFGTVPFAFTAPARRILFLFSTGFALACRHFFGKRPAV